MPSDLTISIINHSNPQLLYDCLRSIYSTNQRATIDVWVVDNATDRRLISDIQFAYPDVRWIFNTHRLGFSANHNQVLKAVESRYVCILNDDTVIHHDALITLVRYLEENKTVAVVAPQLLHSDGTRQINAFREPTIVTEILDVCHLPKFLSGLRCRFAELINGDNGPTIGWLLGACLVVRASTLTSVGLLDDILSPIANVEDVDWCKRFRLCGWQLACCEKAIVTHIGGQSMGKTQSSSSSYYVEMLRARLAYFRKYYGIAGSLTLRCIYFLSVPWNIIMLLQHGIRRKSPLRSLKPQFLTTLAVSKMCLTRWNLPYRAMSGICEPSVMSK